MKLSRYILAFLFSVLFSTHALAALSPLSVNIVNPVQFPPSDYDVTGLRLSVLWGSHRDVSGLDLGVVGNVTTQKFNGAAFSGLFNYTQNNVNAYGFQIAGLTNYNLQKTNVYGVQLAAGANYNKAESSIVGFQMAALNLTAHTNVYGVQAGIYNRAKKVVGLQIGLVNAADNLHGLQIGLLNFHYTGLFYVSPILNFGF